jgi:glycogen operon protein
MGITAVELLPVQQFDEQDVSPPLKNYWGYNTIAFFAPHCGYSSDRSPLGPVNEFRDMVKALHKAGIGVILDVVFNHTAEGNHQGPTLSFKGLENSAYYILRKNPAYYADYTGCGNTFNTNYSIIRRLIRDCLRYWVGEMHVDGFRFDLASVLTRDEDGKPLKNPPILWTIDSDPVLAGTKVIAEPWDAGGLYHLGSFVGDKWAEWNGQFRDDLRRFLKGDNETVQKLACRIIGSPDLYPDPDREPGRTINFVTCHDGFTLNDLVSYDHKHNQANRENNHDGTDANYSWNCGVEGPTDDAAIEALRVRQIKNFLVILLFSQGTPMLLMGDEVRRTQRGNNNAYCQDNQTSWFDWDAVKKNTALLRFFWRLIQFMQTRPIFSEEKLWATANSNHRPHINWHGIHLHKPDWGDSSHSLAFTLHHPESDEHLHVLLNGYWEPLTFQLPPLSGGKHWHRIVDTALASPEDFCELASAPVVEEKFYRLEARASAVLMASGE